MIKSRKSENTSTRQCKHSFTEVCVLCLVTLCSRLCLTLCDPVDCNCQAPLSIGILQARILEWVAMPSSRGSSQPRNQTQVLQHCRRILYHLSHQGSPRILEWVLIQGIFPIQESTRLSCIAGGVYGMQQKQL